MKKKETFKQDQRVKIDTGTLVGIGWIRGKATYGHPFLGESWIVEMETPLCNMVKKDYPYTHVVLFDTQLEAV